MRARRARRDATMRGMRGWLSLDPIAYSRISEQTANTYNAQQLYIPMFIMTILCMHDDVVVALRCPYYTRGHAVAVAAVCDGILFGSAAAAAARAGHLAGRRKYCGIASASA